MLLKKKNNISIIILYLCYIIILHYFKSIQFYVEFIIILQVDIEQI